MRLLIVAGGGGHFAAALAVIEQLPKEWELLVVGRKYAFEADKTISLEYQTAKQRGIPFISLTTGRLQRKVSAQTIQSLARLPVGFFQALRLVRQYRPDVLVSFGGYVSLPVAVAAHFCQVPIVVHEQVLHAGLANRLAGKFADRVCISWQTSERFFPTRKVVLTGNPLRKSLFLLRGDMTKQSHTINSKHEIRNSDLKLIYITGGSGGAHAINILVEGCLEELLKRYTIIHQTGNAKAFGDYERLVEKQKQLSRELSSRYFVETFIDPGTVGSILQKADLVVSRAGINTITELLYFGKPSLFIPLPYGQHNEQLTNALFVKKLGLAEVIEQQTLTPKALLQSIDSMVKHVSSFQSHAKEAKQLIHPDAADTIIQVTLDVAQQKKIQKS